MQAASEVLGACLVTQPRKLADKKSSFLRALRRESSEPNADTTPTSPISPPPAIAAENDDKQVPYSTRLSFHQNVTKRHLKTKPSCLYFCGKIDAPVHLQFHLF